MFIVFFIVISFAEEFLRAGHPWFAIALVAGFGGFYLADAYIDRT